MKIDMTEFLSSDRYPYSAELSLGDGRTFAVKVRASDPDRARAAILEAVGEDLTALGFDPETLLASLGGQAPRGQAAQDLKAAWEALDGDGIKRLGEVLKRADGAGVADVIGSWDFTQEVTPDACAALPIDLKAAIMQLSAGAVLPAAKLSFCPASPR